MNRCTLGIRRQITGNEWNQKDFCDVTLYQLVIVFYIYENDELAQLVPPVCQHCSNFVRLSLSEYNSVSVSCFDHRPTEKLKRTQVCNMLLRTYQFLFEFSR